MKVVGIMPIKLHNERCPGKNTRVLGDKPLLQYALDSLVKTQLCDEVYVYCSDRGVCNYLPGGVKYLQRPEKLDRRDANFTQIFELFYNQIDADVYVYVHATAPFVTSIIMKECIQAVLSREYDSSFCAIKLQDYLWQNGKPLNFDATNIPRTQDLCPIYQETSGIYVFEKKVFQQYRRRIGNNPYIKVLNFKEAIDIDEPEDFELAEIMCRLGL